MVQLTKKGASSCIEKLDHEGMVNSIWTFGTPFIGAICNCDMKYCLGMRSTFGMGMKPMFRAEQLMAIDKEECISCGACQSICQLGAIQGPVDGKYQIDHKKCIGCGACRSTCAVNAIDFQ